MTACFLPETRKAQALLHCTAATARRTSIPEEQNFHRAKADKPVLDGQICVFLHEHGVGHAGVASIVNEGRECTGKLDDGITRDAKRVIVELGPVLRLLVGEVIEVDVSLCDDPVQELGNGLGDVRGVFCWRSEIGFRGSNRRKVGEGQWF